MLFSLSRSWAKKKSESSTGVGTQILFCWKTLKLQWSSKSFVLFHFLLGSIPKSKSEGCKHTGFLHFLFYSSFLQRSIYTKMNIWIHSLFWADNYPTGPDDARCTHFPERDRTKSKLARNRTKSKSARGRTKSKSARGRTKSKVPFLKPRLALKHEGSN